MFISAFWILSYFTSRRNDRILSIINPLLVLFLLQYKVRVQILRVCDGKYQTSEELDNLRAVHRKELRWRTQCLIKRNTPSSQHQNGNTFLYLRGTKKVRRLMTALPLGTKVWAGATRILDQQHVSFLAESLLLTPDFSLSHPLRTDRK